MGELSAPLLSAGELCLLKDRTMWHCAKVDFVVSVRDIGLKSGVMKHHEQTKPYSTDTIHSHNIITTNITILTRDINN